LKEQKEIQEEKKEDLIKFYLCPHKYQVHSSPLTLLVVGNANTSVPLSGTNALPAIAARGATVLAGNLVVCKRVRYFFFQVLFYKVNSRPTQVRFSKASGEGVAVATAARVAMITVMNCIFVVDWLIGGSVD
jgi:hypothetical protein